MLWIYIFCPDHVRDRNMRLLREHCALKVCMDKHAFCAGMSVCVSPYLCHTISLRGSPLHAIFFCLRSMQVRQKQVKNS